MTSNGNLFHRRNEDPILFGYVSMHYAICARNLLNMNWMKEIIIFRIRGFISYVLFLYNFIQLTIANSY